MHGSITTSAISMPRSRTTSCPATRRCMPRPARAGPTWPMATRRARAPRVDRRRKAMTMRRARGVLGLSIAFFGASTARAQTAAGTAGAAGTPVAPEMHDMEQLSQLNLNGNGDRGEGMALQVKDGRRILYLAHE